MGSLKDFLAEQAERLETEVPKAAQRRDEWVAAVDRLTQQIKDWLREADPDGKVLDVRERVYPLRDVGIGHYEVRGLSIGLGPNEVRVEPITRNTRSSYLATGVHSSKRSFGLVNLTNGLQKFMIFRVENDPRDCWDIVEQDGYRTMVFDQAGFEKAFMSLLE